MAARRRGKAELLPQPVPQVPGQLPLFARDETAWWTERPEWSPQPPEEGEEQSQSEGPWGSDEAPSAAGDDGGGK